MGPEEQRLVDAIAAREDELVALLCDLIRFDTTSRDDPGAPARDEAALQAHLAARLGAAGADVDVWEPAPEDVAGHPVTPAGGIGFAGRPQLAARFAAPAAAARCSSTATSTSSPPAARTAGRMIRSTRRWATAGSAAAGRAT